MVCLETLVCHVLFSFERKERVVWLSSLGVATSTVTQNRLLFGISIGQSNCLQNNFSSIVCNPCGQFTFLFKTDSSAHWEDSPILNHHQKDDFSSSRCEHWLYQMGRFKVAISLSSPLVFVCLSYILVLATKSSWQRVLRVGGFYVTCQWHQQSAESVARF